LAAFVKKTFAFDRHMAETELSVLLQQIKSLFVDYMKSTYARDMYLLIWKVDSQQNEPYIKDVLFVLFFFYYFTKMFYGSFKAAISSESSIVFCGKHVI
jgi:hypothetical protein